MKVFEKISKNKGNEDFDFEDVNASFEPIRVVDWEKFTIYMAYVAELHIYKKPVNFDDFIVVNMRDKLVDIFVQLLRFG